MQKSRVTFWLYNITTRLLTGILGKSTGVAGRGFLWRLTATLILLEISRRHRPGLDIAAPFIRFERFFAHDDFYLERFQNLVAGEFILVDLLDKNWFETLHIKQRVLVTALFRRIKGAENVGLTYRNRTHIVDKLGTIENHDQDSLPPEIFLPAPIIADNLDSPAFRFRQGILSVFSSIAGIIRATGGLILTALSGLLLITVGLLILPIRAISAIGIKSNSINSALAAFTRLRLAQIRDVTKSGNRFAKILAKYDQKFGTSQPAMSALGEQLLHPRYKPVFTGQWLNTLALPNRVLASTVLRKLGRESQSQRLQTALKMVSSDLNVKNQRDVYQLTHPDRIQKSELAFFRKLANYPDATDKKVESTGGNQASSPDISMKLNVNSEAILKDGGWFSAVRGPIADLNKAIRQRSYYDIINFGRDETLYAQLPDFLKEKLGAIFVILKEPVTDVMKAGFAHDRNFLVPLDGEENFTRAMRARNKAHDSFFKKELATEQPSIRKNWINLQLQWQNDGIFSTRLEALIRTYRRIPIARINVRSLSYDTFLILDLEEILQKAELWLDWDDCSPSAIAAIACASIHAQNHTLFNAAIQALREKPKVPPAYIDGLVSSYFSMGIHCLNSFDETVPQPQSTLKTLDPKKKYLCLVEGAALIRPLRQLGGVTDNNLICAPVIPTDAPRYPAQAELQQVDQYISVYSVEDMKLAFEIDTVVEHYLDKARDQFRDAGLDDRYIEAIEISHATVFFAVYRDALAARTCEKILDKAADYDGIIFLMRTGAILGDLVKVAGKSIGKDNVFVSLETERAPDLKDTLALLIDDSSQSSKTQPSATPDTNTSTSWLGPFNGWLNTIIRTHENQVKDMSERPYALLGLEHINGYFDSYEALTTQSLNHFDVEIFTTPGNKHFNEHIRSGGFDNIHSDKVLSHCSLGKAPPPARDWTTLLLSSLSNAFDDNKSPWIKNYRNMVEARLSSVFAQRLPQILNAVSYFKARFALATPAYVFTGPNQHMITRAACYAALAKDIPVYDFLILASTHHPRYRYPVASHAYIYDPWYSDIFEDYMRMPSDKIRVSGPLFDYSERLTQIAANSEVDENLTHIVFFSQSGNFENSCLMLEGICAGAKAVKDQVYLTVKMHPHESPANIEKYATLISDNNMGDNSRVIHHGNAVELINEADLVVQSFSNTGLDALLMKTPVITFKPKSNLKARIFLYEKEIGFVVKTKAALTKKLKTFLSDPEDRKSMLEMAEKFAVENEHFLRKDNAERVMNQVLIDLGRDNTPNI